MTKPGPRPQEGPREPNGRLQRPTAAEREAAQAVVLEARMRRHGQWPEKPVRKPGETDKQFARRKIEWEQICHELRKAFRQPWMGCLAGRKIDGQPDVVALWDAVNAVRSKREAYLHAIGTQEHAKTARLVTEPAPDEDGVTVSTSDDRTEEERDVDAINAWDRLWGIMHRLGPGTPEAMVSIICRDIDVAGFRFVWAIGRVAKWLR